jgi:Planctomycete cytochrome C
MKTLKINVSNFFSSMHRRLVTIAVISYFLFQTSYLLSGCQYTIDGNPDIDLTEVHVSPVAATVVTNGKLILTASVLGFSNTASVTWSIDGGVNMVNGTITPNGSSAVYLAPALLTSRNQVAVITVTSSEDANRSVNDTISIVGATKAAFGASPDSVWLLTNAIQQFSVDTIFPNTPPLLRWEIVSGSGSISDSGLYTAPASIAMDGVQTMIRAVSLMDSTVFSQCTITLLNSSDSMLCFTRDILPILSANCGISGCHDPTTHAGGYNFNTYEGSIGSVGHGSAQSSRLFMAITQFNVNSRMPPPPQPALGPTQVLKIGEWIDEGGNDCQ